jgi:hypothetical protein
MILSRVKPAISAANESAASNRDSTVNKNVPKFEDYLKKRDYTGAMTLLEVRSAPLHILKLSQKNL